MEGVFDYMMRKNRRLLVVALCAAMLFCPGTGKMVSAAELPEIEEEEDTVDDRPDYVVYVNRALNCVTVKLQNEDGTLTPVKAMLCSCGRAGSSTPEGTFRTSNYYEWRRMVDDTFGRYAVRFNGKILFHSVPYIEDSPDTLKWEEYNRLGESASLGCVRLAAEDAKWIYDNCKPGTQVVVYSDEEEAGELGKPTVEKIDADSPYRLWDPTDDCDENPWFGGDGILAVPFTGTVEEFDYVAYADRYADLREVFGYDKEALYEHYVTCGMDEGRIAQGIDSLEVTEE